MLRSWEIKLSKGQKIIDFAKKLCVDQTYVSDYLEHLHNMSSLHNIRSNESNSKKTSVYRCVEDYDWQDLVISGKLKSLVIQELEKISRKTKSQEGW